MAAVEVRDPAATGQYDESQVLKLLPVTRWMGIAAGVGRTRGLLHIGLVAVGALLPLVRL